MKKTILIILLSISFIANSQNKGTHLYPEESKKNWFGVGLTTNILYGNVDADNFVFNDLTDLEISFRPYSKVDMQASVFFSLAFEYQFQFSNNWFVSSKLKFNYRDVRYTYVMDGTSIWDNHYIHQGGTVWFNTIDLEIPVIMNFKLPLSDNSNWIISAGGGINSNLAVISQPDGLYMDDYSCKISLYADVIEKITPIIYLGTGFDFNVGKHKIQTTLSYTIYTYSNYETGYSVSKPLEQEPYNYYSKFSKFAQNNIEVGLIFFW
jgi:hypothetical protein